MTTANTEAKGTTKNARYIEREAAKAVENLSKALDNLRNIQEAIKNGENEPEYKLPEFVQLDGLVMIGLKQARMANQNWTGYADARARG